MPDEISPTLQRALQLPDEFLWEALQTRDADLRIGAAAILALKQAGYGEGGSE